MEGELPNEGDLHTNSYKASESIQALALAKDNQETNPQSPYGSIRRLWSLEIAFHINKIKTIMYMVFVSP